MSVHAITPLDGPVSAVVDVPGSKSVANRALVCAALADGESQLDGMPPGDDTAAKHLKAEWQQNSYLGRAGKALEPAFRPLGWDWKIGMAALASFPAREVIVGTLGIIYEQGDDVDTDDDVGRTVTSVATTRVPVEGSGRYVLVWITSVVPVDDGNRAEVGEVRVVVPRTDAERIGA